VVAISGVVPSRPLIARDNAVLPPASPPVEAPTTEQDNDDYNDKKRGHVHGFCVLRQSAPNIRNPARHAFNFADLIFVATFGQREREVSGRGARRPTELSARVGNGIQPVASTSGLRPERASLSWRQTAALPLVFIPRLGRADRPRPSSSPSEGSDIGRSRQRRPYRGSTASPCPAKP
jgi:hypothetical protein